MNAATPLTRLADWAASLAWSEIPAEQHALVPLRVLDTIGLVLAGAGTEAVRIALDHAAAQGGAAEASLFVAAKRLPASSVALVHGVAAHCRDFDDTFADSVVHPGSAVVSTALAAGEAARAEAEDIGAAMVAGYEIAARLGATAGRRFHARGLHATGVVGPIAAAVTAARASRLSPAATASAMGLAASMSGGLMAFQTDGAWSKWLHVGWAAAGGITAAALAARGFRGPLAALEGRGSLYDALLAGETPDLTQLTAALGAEWRGGGAQFKYYPCAHVIQPYIDAALFLRESHDLAVADIASVRCRIAPWAVPIVCQPRPQRLAPASELDAIASLPYMVACALAGGSPGLDALSEAERGRRDLQALAELVTEEGDPSLGQGFDAEIEIRTKGGAVHRAKRNADVFDPARLTAKFVANTSPRLGPEGAADAARRLKSMSSPDTTAIAALLMRS